MNSKSWRLGNMLSRWLAGSQDNIKDAPAEEKTTYDKEVSSAEGHLRIVPGAQELEFYSTFVVERMLALKVSLGGPLSKFVKNEGVNEVVITVPVVEADGNKHNIKSIYYGPKKSGKGHVKLVQASKGSNAEGECFYEFVYTQAGEDIRYVIEMPEGIEASDFKEVVDKRPLFSSIPSIAQMSAFLRAVINRKRTVFDVLDSLRKYAAPTTMLNAAVLQDAVENHGLELSYDLPLRIKKLLTERAKVISEHVILALALFIDMEVGELKSTDITGAETITASVASLYTVANYFGAKISFEDWKELFGDTGVTLTEVQEKQLIWSYSSILSEIGQLSSDSTPLSTLQQIAKESGSKRTISFAKALQERLGSNDLAISDQQLALLATLSVAKCHYSPNLVSALCLFVDAEIGYIKESDLANASIEIDGLETSTYAMLAVAGAFGVSLRGLNLDNLSEEELQMVLPCLVRLTGAGFLGGFRKSEETKQNWHWVRTSQAAKKALKSNRGVEFTNNVLCMLPLIEQLSEIDLVHLVESGRDFIAAFQSDYDKNIVWRRLKEIPETSFRIPQRDGKARQSYSFIEGFSAYHFSRTIIGSLIKPALDELLGASSVIMVFHDNRDNRHYKYLEKISTEDDLQPPPNTGWVWKGEIVDNLDITGLPNTIYEMSQNILLGRDVQASRESRLLNLIFEALRRTVLRKTEYDSILDYPSVCELVRQRLPQLRETVKNYLDDYTFNTILDWFEEDTRVIVQLPLRIFNCLNDENHLDMVCLLLLYSLAASDFMDRFLGAYYKQVDLSSFRVLLNERIAQLLSSENAESKILGLRLLASPEFAEGANSRLMVEYNLTQALDDANSNVSFVACEGLVRLCLSSIIPLPAFTVLLEKEVQDEEDAEDDDEEIPVGEAVIDRRTLQDVTMELEEWAEDLHKSNPDEYRALPFISIDGSVDSELMQNLARFLAVLRQTSYDEYGTLPRRYYALISERQLKLICSVIVETWRQMVKANGISLCEMLEEATPAELFIDQRFFVRGHEKQIYDTFGVYPYLGGSGKPVTIYHFKPEEVVAPYRQVSRSISATGKEQSPFFKDLVQLFYAQGDTRMVLLRLHSVEGMELSELETFLSSFETTHSVDLRTAERFDPEHACYVPVFRTISFTPEQMGSTYEEKADFQALMGLLGGKKIALKKEETEKPEAEAAGSAVDSSVDSSAGNNDAQAEEQESIIPQGDEIPDEPELEEWINDEDSGIATAQVGLDLAPFNDMAGQLRKSFSLPAEMERPLVNMLLLVERHSSKPFLSAREQAQE